VTDQHVATPPTFVKISLLSEMYRIYAMMALAGAVLLLWLIRIDLTPGVAAFPWLQVSMLVVVPGYGLLPLAVLARCRTAEAPVPRWLTIANMSMECAFPTAAIAFLWLGGILPPERAVTAPALLWYALVLILSPLRLSPGACMICGLLCAAGYTALIAAVANHIPVQGEGDPLPLGVLLSYPVLVLLCGVAAAFVAAQFRRFVRAMVHEAQLRHAAEHEISAAAEIQQGLLPQTPPEFPGFVISFWNRPADTTGGDYYDWQRLPDGTLAVSLADVAGHGLAPALVAAFCRAYSRATLRAGNRLAEAVARVNVLVADDVPDGRFITFVVALLAPDSDEVRMVSAGHGPLLVYRAATDTVEQRKVDGVPLGIHADSEFALGEPLHLQDGDAIILVTDGFYEWSRATRNGSSSDSAADDDRFGIDRLIAVIIAAAKHDGDIIAAMRNAVEAFAANGGKAPPRQVDDLTAVVIQRRIAPTSAS